MEQKTVLLSREEIRKLAAKNKRSWEIAYYCAVMDMENAKGVRILFDPAGDTSYFNAIDRLIVVGLSGAVNEYKIAEEWKLNAAVRMLRIHETGHLMYTANEPYVWGIKRGAELILEGISKRLEKRPRKFRKDADYAYFAEQVLPNEYGIFMDYKLLIEAVQNIINALEDGRIERILSNQYTGFEKLRRYFNGVSWQNGQVRINKETAENSPRIKLGLYFNEILFLAIVQLNSIGFHEEFAGTEIEEGVRSLHPYIFAGITATTTRDMVMRGLLPICEALSPLMLEACQSVPGQDMSWLEQILRELIIKSIDEMDENNTGVPERDALGDDSEFNPTFPMSDLEVTLPDDVYDKLMDKLKDKGASEDGIRVKREHPLPPEESDESPEESEKGSDGNGSQDSANGESAADKETSPDGSGDGDGMSGQESMDDFTESTNASGSEEDAGSDEEGAESGESRGGSGSKDDESREQESSSTSSAGAGEEMEAIDPEDAESSYGSAASDGNETDEQNEANAKPSSKESGSQKGQQKDKTDPFDGASSMEDALAEIEKEMEEAAEKLKAEAEAGEVSINAASHTATRSRMKDVPSRSVPLGPVDVKSVCPREFIEVFRRYELDERLPVDLEAKGKTAHKKYELLARNRKKPVSRYRKEGKIDTRSIYRLGMNKTDVFMKDGKVDEFDGCAYILIDNSGSMMGAKRYAACCAAAVQEEAFKGLFPFKIVAFDETSKIVHEVVKDWNEQRQQNCCWNFSQHGRYGSGNADEHDIRIATMELLKRSERKKLLIVLSDGAPDDCEDTKRAIQEARKKGISVFGIYFEEGEMDERYAKFFVDMYEKDYVLCEVDQIEANLSRLMERFFRS